MLIKNGFTPLVTSTRWYFKLFVLFLLSVPAVVQAVTGEEWLETQTNPDGSYAAPVDVAIPYQSTVEVLRTYQVTGQLTQAGMNNALSYVLAEGFHNTENLSRKIIVNVGNGIDSSALITELIALQNEDGGFGELNKYESTVVDTAYALEALAYAGINDPDIISTAVSFLEKNANSDGGYALNNENTSSVYITALVNIALQQYRFSFNTGTLLANTRDYLLQARNATALWTSDWESALALLAIIPVTSDSGSYQQSIISLRNKQLISGAWEESVYSTALVLRALNIANNITFPSNPTLGLVSGKVVESTSGIPLSSVKLSLVQTPSLQTLSLNNGVFSIDDITPGTYNLLYQLDGYFEINQSIDVQAGQALSLGTTALSPLPDVGVIYGRILDSAGLPLSGVSIQVSGASNVSVLSNSQGEYQITAPAGAISLSASLAGYDNVSATGTVISANRINFSPVLYANGTTPALQNVVVQGVVVDDNTDQVLSAVLLSVNGTTDTALSDTSGGFSLQKNTGGEFSISISKTGYKTRQVNVIATTGSTIDLSEIRLTVDVPTSVSNVSGLVTDFDTGAAISGATIKIDGAQNGVLSDASGRFILQGVLPTQFNLGASSPGYFAQTNSVSAAQPGSYIVNFKLKRAAAANFDISTVTTNSTTIPALTEIDVVAELNNSDVIDQSVRLFVKVLDGQNKVIEQYPARIIPLGGDPSLANVVVPQGTTIASSVNWNSARHRPGIYQIVVQAYDGNTGLLLAERGIPVTVAVTSAIGGNAVLNPPVTTLSANQPISISANIVNRGNQIVGSSSLTTKVTLKTKGIENRSDLVEVRTRLNDALLNNHGAMDIDANGNIYAVMASQNKVIKITPDGVITDFLTGLASPLDIDIDEAGNIYVLLTFSGYYKIEPSGAQSFINTGLFPQAAIKALADGRVLISTEKSIYQVSVAGVVSPLISGGMSSPQGITANSQNEIFIANRWDHTISKFSNGELSTFVTNINQPYGLTVDNSDNLYVTSFYDNTLLKISPSGVVSTIATNLSGPYDVKIAPSGNFIVSNSISNEIVQITVDGVVSVLAKGLIAEPTGLAYDGAGNVYVGNKTTRNITRINSNGSSDIVTTGIAEPKSILVNQDGSLDVLSTSREIIHVNPDGSQNSMATGLVNAHSVINAPDGNGLIVSQPPYNKLSRVDASQTITAYLEPQYSNARLTRSLADGSLIIASSDGYITKIDPALQLSRIASGFSFIQGLAVDQNQNIYISSSSTRQITKIDAAGVSSVIATATFSPGPLAINAAGELFVSVYRGRDVYKLDAAAGTFSLFDSFDYAISDDLLMDNAGTLWAAHSNNRSITRRQNNGVKSLVITNGNVRSMALAANGGILAGLTGGIQQIDSAGIATDVSLPTDITATTVITGVHQNAAGEYWLITDSGVIFRISSSGTLLTRYGSLEQPKGLAVLSDGSIVVACLNTVLKVENVNGLHPILVDGTFEQIAVDTGNNLLLASTANLKRFNLTSGVVSDFASGFVNIGAIAVAASGDVSISDTSKNELSYFNASGIKTDSFVGLVEPRGLAYTAAGELLVANGNAAYIAKLRADGRVEKFADVTNAYYLQSDTDGTVKASTDTAITTINSLGDVLSVDAATNARGIIHTSDNTQYYASQLPDALYTLVSGSVGTQVASGMGNVNEIETDANGTIYFGDAAAGSINKLNNDGTRTLLVDNLPELSSLAMNASGDFYAAYLNNHMAKIASDGTRNNMQVSGAIQNPIKALFFNPAGDLLAGAPYAQSFYFEPLKSSLFEIIPPAFKQSGIQPGEVVYSKTSQLPTLGLVDTAEVVDFGAWTPTASGEYLVEITSDNANISGTINNALHVGTKTDSTFALSKSSVLPGSQSVTGYLNVTGGNGLKLTKIDVQGTFLAANTASKGRGIVSDTSGNIYASDITKIVKATPAGNISDFVTGVSISSELAIDSSNTIYAASGTQLIAISPQGVSTVLLDTGSTISGIATDYNDNLYIIEQSGFAQINKLSKVNPDGTLQLIANIGAIAAQGMTIDAFGNFYIQLFNYKVIRISADGLNTSTYLTEAIFEYEGLTITADCSNNLIFAPIELPVIKPRQDPHPIFGDITEEDTLVQLIGDTGEMQKILDGPAYNPELTDMDVLYFDRFNQRLLVWTDNALGKVFSIPVTCGGIASELHVITRSDVDLSTTVPAPTSIADLTGGNKEYIWNLPDQGVSSSNIQMNLLFNNLVEGETRPAVTEAYVSFDNSFSPGELVKVPITVPEVSVINAITVAPTLDANQYGPDAIANITIAVANGSDTPLDGTVQLSILDDKGARVSNLPDLAVSNLNASTTLNLLSEWNTGNTYVGSYTLVAKLLSTSNQQIATGRVDFLISAEAAGGVIANASVNSDKPQYSPWDNVQIFARIRNASSNATLEAGLANIRVLSPGGATLYNTSLPVGSIYNNGYQNVESSYHLVDAVDGVYTLNLTYRDAQTGNEIKQATSSFLVSRTRAQNLKGEVNTSVTTVAAGDAISCTLSTTNISATTLSGIQLEYLLINMDSGEIVRQSTQSQPLLGTTTVTNSVGFSTTGLVAGDYACLLRANDGGQITDLAMSGVKITAADAPLILIESNLAVADTARVLVLMDDDSLTGINAQNDVPDPEHLNSSEHDDDTLHNSLEPVDLQQKALIEQLLQQKGFSYSITHTRESFIEAFRSGDYSTYLLLAEHIELSDQVIDELTEAVNLGAGLLLAGDKHSNLHKLDKALGVNFKGSSQNTQGIELLTSPLAGAQQLDFPYADKVIRAELRAQLNKAQIAANYKIDSPIVQGNHDIEADDELAPVASDATTRQVAISYYPYGKGKSVFVGFDLLALATQQGSAHTLAQLINSGLDYIKPPSARVLAGGAVPIELTLVNKGAATAGEVAFSHTAGTSIADAGAAQVITGNQLRWVYNLALNETKTLRYWLHLPNYSANVSVQAIIKTGVDPQLSDYATKYLHIGVSTLTMLDELKTLVSTLPSHPQNNKVMQHLDNSVLKAKANDLVAAVAELLEAAKELEQMDSAAATEVRLEFDHYILCMAKKIGKGQ